jgi:hypothetical protein
MMKKLILILALLIPLAASAARPKSVSRTEITSIISDFRHYDGVEVVRLGRLATGALKGIIRTAGISDPDTRQALQLIQGLKGLTVLEYEDAPSDIRYRLDHRIERALQKSELLMEAKEDGTHMRMFGVVDDAAGTVRDFVIYVPDSSSLICLFGSMSLEALKAAMAND